MNEELFVGSTEAPVQYENVHFNGSTKLVLWMLGIFGSVMLLLLALVLQAIYSTNGAVNKLAGQELSSQAQIQNMQTELAAFQSEMMGLAQRQKQ